MGFVAICIFSVCLKLLFIPLYHSTDMEVHRNWMAITHNKPIDEWYKEATSDWTLDYPPLFAWLEYALSYAAKFFDPVMLNIQKESYTSENAQLFMRLSVIFTDILYMVAVKRLSDNFWKSSSHCDPWLKVEVVFAMLMLLNPGLLIVDHIHFQYNGFLFGLLLMSVAALKQEKYLESAVWYTVLVNFKHLYLYLAPAYFIYFLKNFCFTQHASDGAILWQKFSLKRFAVLSGTVIAVFLLSLGPFCLKGQLSQVLQRIFPVKRGLTHAYWAPNFWALYNAFDCLLVFLAHRIGMKIHGVSSMTKGLVQEYRHRILPSIGMGTTLVLTCISIMPFLYQVWKRPKNINVFLQCLVGCAFGSFLFGYHVHEKAVLTIILPFTILAVSHSESISNYVLLSSAGHLALFPLLHQSAETSVKVVIFVLHAAYMITGLRKLHEKKSANVISWQAMFHVLLFPAVYGLFTFGLQVSSLNKRLPFLPLMVLSCYCAVCILYCWINMCQISFKMTNVHLKRH